MGAVSPVMRVFAVALLTAAIVLAAPTHAGALVVDRVVAVVGKKPITLAQLRARARPFVRRLERSGASEADKTVGLQQVYRDVVERLIDEEIMQRVAAASTHGGPITVSSQEIDAGIANVAKDAKSTPAEILALAKEAGYSAEEYREEIRRQILEGKLLQAHVQQRVRDADPRDTKAYGEKLQAARRAWLDEQRAATFVEVRL